MSWNIWNQFAFFSYNNTIQISCGRMLQSELFGSRNGGTLKNHPADCPSIIHFGRKTSDLEVFGQPLRIGKGPATRPPPSRASGFHIAVQTWWPADKPWLAMLFPTINHDNSWHDLTWLPNIINQYQPPLSAATLGRSAAENIGWIFDHDCYPDEWAMLVP